MTRSARHAMVSLPALAILAVLGFNTAAAEKVDSALTAAIANPSRMPADVARDKARHPLEELTFFGLEPTQTVVELWPGGGYWTGILGPYLAEHGHYYAAVPPSTDSENAGTLKWRALCGPSRALRQDHRDNARGGSF